MITYVDTSTLLKLLIDEDGSEQSRLIWDAADVLASVGVDRRRGPRRRSPQRKRGGRLTAAQHRDAKAELVELFEELSFVEITER